MVLLKNEIACIFNFYGRQQRFSGNDGYSSAAKAIMSYNLEISAETNMEILSDRCFHLSRDHEIGVELTQAFIQMKGMLHEVK